MEMPTIHRPIPRRTFDFTPASPEDSVPPSPANEPENANLLASATSRLERSAPPSRTRSILNLTSSTLLGIYSGATDGGREELHTPWGTGAQTPAYPQSGRTSIDGGQDAFLRPSHASLNARRPSNFHKVRPRKTFRHYYLPLVFQTVMLFGFGSGFGMLATHLQRTQQIAPIPIPAERTDAWYYQVAWGLLGVAIGNALPHIDQLFTDDSAISDEPATAPQKYEHIRSLSSSSRNEQERMNLADSGTGPMWHSAVRSAGAFVGIAFALRKVPWQSTLQVSLTLAVANPVLWYLIDRSKPGFAVSTLVSLSGTFLSLLFNPDFVPVPKIYQEQTSEKVGVYVWLGSILFCFSLCFGAIGRRLQL